MFIVFGFVCSTVLFNSCHEFAAERLFPSIETCERFAATWRDEQGRRGGYASSSCRMLKPLPVPFPRVAEESV